MKKKDQEVIILSACPLPFFGTIIMERITHKKKLVAIKLKKFKKGTFAITDPLQPLQLVAHKHPMGTYIKAHVHTPKKRITAKLQECLIVIKGKIRVDLYSSKKEFFKKIYLSAGNSLILIDGGWAVHINENSEFVELKNGPYLKDKLFIE